MSTDLGCKAVVGTLVAADRNLVVAADRTEVVRRLAVVDRKLVGRSPVVAGHTEVVRIVADRILAVRRSLGSEDRAFGN